MNASFLAKLFQREACLNDRKDGRVVSSCTNAHVTRYHSSALRTCNHVTGSRRVPTRSRTSLRSLVYSGTRRNHTDSISTLVPDDIDNYVPDESLMLDWNQGEQIKRNGEPSSVTLSDVPPRFDWRKRSFSRLQPKGKEEVKYVSRRTPEPTADYFQSLELSTQAAVYRNRFKPLVDAEENASQEVVTDRLKNWGLKRLIREGYCMTDLHAFWLDIGYIDRHVAAFRIASSDLPSNIFKKGSQVIVSRLDPLKEGRKGSIERITSEQINVAFDSKIEDLDDGLWRLDLGHSNAIYERMREAMRLVEVSPEKIESDSVNKPDQVELISQGTHLQEVLLQSFGSSGGESLALTPQHLQDPGEKHYLSPGQLEHESKLQESTSLSLSGSGRSGGGAFADNCLIRSWASRYRRPNPVVVEGDPDLTGLNSSQVRAMAMMVGERISLVQGPPGTGKTKTLVETVKLLKGTFEVPQPLLVCTYTNVAVDNLLENIAAAGLKPLRYGNESPVSSGMEEYMLEVQFDKHPLRPEYDTLVKRREEQAAEVKRLKAMFENTKKELEGAGPRKAALLKQRIPNMESHFNRATKQLKRISLREYVIYQRILRNILMKADVICTTCVKSASPQMRAMDFPVVFLDEASMSTEPASLIPIMKGCRHLALIGDHKQLPPIVQSEEARAGGLDISLFERLIREGKVPSVMLDTQYRMHPNISKFPSAEFYDLMLLDGTVCRKGQVLPSLLPPSSSHLPADPQTGHRPSLVFIDHEGPEETRSKSRVNYMESFIVISIIEDLLKQNKSLGGQDIGVIAAYKSQVNLISRLLTRDARALLIQRLGKDRALELSNIEVKTVDGFEGRQKEAIVFSTVRNNASGYIGFLADRRRLNVGLTRAKRALFVVGSMNTLKTGKYRRSLSSDNELATDSRQTSTTSGGALAWRNYAQFLTEQKLVLKLSGPEWVKTLDPYAKIYNREMCRTI